MATEFSREFFADNRIVKASLRCAHKLREKDLDRIKSEIKKLYDATEVILNITVDESLLSGYVLQVGDRVFDNSGRHQLDKMMEGKPSLATLKTRIEDYKPAETSAEGGVVISSADGIVHIDGMNRAVYGEIVTFDNGAKGMVESVDPEQLGIMLFDGAETVGVGTMVTAAASVPASRWAMPSWAVSSARWASPSTAKAPSRLWATTPSRSRPPASSSARAWIRRSTPASSPSTPCSPLAAVSVS